MFTAIASLWASSPLIYSRYLTILGSCYCIKQIDVSFYASVLLLMINFVMTLSKLTAEPLACGSWFHSHYDNFMTQFIINKRTDALKTDVNLLNRHSFERCATDVRLKLRRLMFYLSLMLWHLFYFLLSGGKGPVHHGVCSTWLNSLQPGDKVPCYVRQLVKSF